jgi:hypothetical protein
MDKFKSTFKIFKNHLDKWQSELNEYRKWVFDNNDAVSFSEREKIDRIALDILLINTRILKLERSMKLINLSPEDEIMGKYCNKLIEFQSYYSNVTCSNRMSSVIEQKDVDMVAESLKLVKEMQDYYQKNIDKIEIYASLAENYTIQSFEKRLEDVKNWQSLTKERHLDSSLKLDYKSPKKEGPQALLPPRNELLTAEYYDPELNEDYGVIYEEFDNLPLYDHQLGIEETDVIQGNLGDCYAISALSAIAKADPELIRKNIKPLGNNLFEVTLYVRELVDGKATNRLEKKVIVDSDFPIEVLDDGTRKPVYAHSENKEIWPMIMEKAYAKAMGGYDNIVSGAGEEALSVFTGKTIRTFIVMSGNKFCETIKIDNKFIDKDYNKVEFLKIMLKSKLALFDSSKNAFSEKELKLQKNHSYSLSSFDGKTIRLRNPQGINDFEFYVHEDNIWESFSRIALL